MIAVVRQIVPADAPDESSHAGDNSPIKNIDAEIENPEMSRCKMSSHKPDGSRNRTKCQQ